MPPFDQPYIGDSQDPDTICVRDHLLELLTDRDDIRPSVPPARQACSTEILGFYR
jgi:hypothetical protein